MSSTLHAPSCPSAPHGFSTVVSRTALADDARCFVARLSQRSDGREPRAGEYRFVAQSRVAAPASGKRVKASHTPAEPPPSSSELSETLPRSTPKSAGRAPDSASRRPSISNDPAYAWVPMPATGAILGHRYRIESTLRAGGMGAVFQAHDLRLDIDVAVKLIRREVACAQATDRLVKEARAAARISHPSTVRVLDVDIDERCGPFLVMELLRGTCLADTLGAGVRYSPEEAVSLLLPIVGAAHAAHAEGVVHRDIKPQNVVLVPDEHGNVVPKLVDFGVARLTEEPAHVRLTIVGTLVGSLEYMAPEQAEGLRNVDAQADVWGLSVLLYELVTGTTPFRGKNPLAVLTAIRAEDVRLPTELAHEPELWSILRRGLERERSDRWASARDLGKALAAWALGRGIGVDVAGTSLATHWLSRRLTPVPPAPKQ